MLIREMKLGDSASVTKTVTETDVYLFAGMSGNAESIFFPLEKDGSMVGMNETKSGFLTIWLKDNKLDKLKIWPTPTGTMTPIPDLKPDQKYLKDFYWFDYIRPKDKDDIYQVVKRKAQDAPKRSNKFVH